MGPQCLSHRDRAGERPLGRRAAARRKGNGGRRRPAFTLVELLVIVAVIAILLGVLLPALGRTREASRVVWCLNNMRQLTVAYFLYAEDYKGASPLLPAINPNTGNVSFCSWSWGGKTSSTYWYSPSRYNPNWWRIHERPLNAYLYPDIILRDPEPGDENRLELDLYRCPSDQGTLQRTFWNARTVADPFITSYDDVGTSYHANVRWWFQMVDLARQAPSDRRPSTIQLWDRLKWLHRIAAYEEPSKFVWLHDQTMDYVTHTPHSWIGDHGEKNRCTAAFLDGHAEYLTAEPLKEVTPQYRLVMQWIYRLIPD